MNGKPFKLNVKMNRSSLLQIACFKTSGKIPNAPQDNIIVQRTE